MAASVRPQPATLDAYQMMQMGVNEFADSDAMGFRRRQIGEEPNNPDMPDGPSRNEMIRAISLLSRQQQQEQEQLPLLLRRM